MNQNLSNQDHNFQRNPKSDPDDSDALSAEDKALLYNTLDFREIAASTPGVNVEELNEAVHEILPECLRGQKKMFRHGWDLLLQYDATGSAAHVKDSLKHLPEDEGNDSEELPNLCSDEDWAHLLPLPVAALKADKEEEATAMYSVLQALRPQAHEPYIASFSLFEAKAGPELAADCYRFIQPLMLSPTFSYYAAACFQRAQALPEARASIQNAVDLLNDETYAFSPNPSLHKRILDLHQALLTQENPNWERT